jgi:hypothetical protein
MQGEKTMKETVEERTWVSGSTIFLEGQDGVWPKEIVIKENSKVLRYRLIRTRSGKFLLVK